MTRLPSCCYLSNNILRHKKSRATAAVPGKAQSTSVVLSAQAGLALLCRLQVLCTLPPYWPAACGTGELGPSSACNTSYMNYTTYLTDTHRNPHQIAKYCCASINFKFHKCFLLKKFKEDATKYGEQFNYCSTH